MLIGSGNYQYEPVEHWAKLPSGLQWGYTHGIVTDKDNNIYVFHTGKPSLVCFNAEGQYVKSWGEQFEGAHGCYLHQEQEGEFLYLTDTVLGLAVKATLDGQVLLTLNAPDLPEVYHADAKYKPTDIAVAPNGDIYVADGYGQSYIHQYTAKGEYIRSWGGAGNAPGQLHCPHGISVNLRGQEPELYVADRKNQRIQVFTLDGVHKRFIAEDMDLPCSFYFHEDDLYFPDLHSRVTVLDRNDKLVVHLGEDQAAYKQTGWPNLPKSYYSADKFSSPHGLCLDRDGNIYVAEWIKDGRITKLQRQ